MFSWRERFHFLHACKNPINSDRTHADARRTDRRLLGVLKPTEHCVLGCVVLSPTHSFFSGHLAGAGVRCSMFDERGVAGESWRGPGGGGYQRPSTAERLLSWQTCAGKTREMLQAGMRAEKRRRAMLREVERARTALSRTPKSGRDAPSVSTGVPVLQRSKSSGATTTTTAATTSADDIGLQSELEQAFAERKRPLTLRNSSPLRSRVDISAISSPSKSRLDTGVGATPAESIE